MDKFSDATCGLRCCLPLFGKLVKRFWQFAVFYIRCNLKHAFTSLRVKEFHNSTDYVKEAEPTFKDDSCLKGKKIPCIA
jgi:hypothetical protein